MITVLVGHRGTGKSELMRRLQLYYVDTPAEFIDLDQEIERKIGRDISELFLEHGEDYFRDIERQLFREVIQREYQRLFICLGAGFDLTVIPETVEVLWVRRATDLDGRIFLNRPRLHPEISPLEEYKKRAEVREALFKSRASRVYTMPEGAFEFKNKAGLLEKAILQEELPFLGGSLTILNLHQRDPLSWSSFKKRFQNKNILFELRDDLLSPEQIEKILKDLPEEKFIYSFRRHFSLENLPSCDFYDWPLEQTDTQGFVQAIPAGKRIFSLHDLQPGEDLKESRQRLEKYEQQAALVKWSPPIQNFAELHESFLWQQQNSAQRNFLPRSSQGRWSWFRALLKGRQKIQFWREDEGSSLDQPTLFAWLATPEPVRKFAAVLGNPVHHSFTPLEHQDYFAKREAPVFAISIQRDEWDQALPILQKLGLHWAAVTSPHKENAARCVGTPGLRAVNTLLWAKDHWEGTSTDEEGFLALTEGLGTLAPLQSQIAVWGGGGTLEMLRRALPKARYFESRTGKAREGETSEADFKALIWAAPRAAETQWPPALWRPDMVVDLNYKEDSMGREYAQSCGANYQSGLDMFLAQARGQRSFWAKKERDT